ncbi:acyloxyacyl hydrolase [Pseudomonas monteilii]|uniref:acyloxyacyl hydrolase n=1 Tax=Pseudomonas monteilii TaxID=76759 RepID=UPI00383A7F7F
MRHSIVAQPYPHKSQNSDENKLGLTLRSASVASLLLSFSGLSNAAYIAGALGATTQGGLTARTAMGFDWGKSWFESDAGRLTGYWDAGVTHWESGRNASDDEGDYPFGLNPAGFSSRGAVIICDSPKEKHQRLSSRLLRHLRSC